MPSWVSDRSKIPDPHGRAARMLMFADLLKHPKDPEGGLGLKRWQRRIIERIYGPSDEHGKRQVRTVFILLPRGNRKTTLGAVLALGHTIGPEQTPGGQVISAASDRQQARIAFDEVAEIIRLDNRLVQATWVRDSKNRIQHPKSRSVYSAISADGDAQHGKTPSFVLADELHVWRGMGLWNALKTGLSKTPGSLLVIITTAGERPEGVAWDLYQYARKVAAGTVTDPTFLPVLFEPEPKDAWDNEKTWHKVNPGLKDGFPDIAALRDEARMARQIPHMRAAFEQLHLNRWQDGSAAGWVEMSVYDEGAAPIDLDALESLPCWLGIDLSKSFDLTALSMVWRHDDGAYTCVPWCFLPETALKRRAATTDVLWKEWAKSGHLITTPGHVISEEVIEAKIREVADRWSPREILFDPKMAGRLMGRLIEDGYPVVEVKQSPVIMSPFYQEMQRAIIGRQFRHGGHPVLRYCVQCAAPIVGDSGLTYLSKKRSNDAIDAAVATGMALGRAALDAGGGDDLYGRADFNPDDVWISP